MSDFIPARIQGIPCLVRIDSYTPAYAGYRGSNLDDWDEDYGPSVEYTVCDRRGRPAPWLARKVTHQDEINILNTLESAK